MKYQEYVSDFETFSKQLKLTPKERESCVEHLALHRFSETLRVLGNNEDKIKWHVIRTP